jgi:hypothetical protein
MAWPLTETREHRATRGAVTGQLKEHGAKRGKVTRYSGVTFS